MAYEVESIGSNVVGPNLPKEIMREERVIDHRAPDKRLQQAQAAVQAKTAEQPPTQPAKSGQPDTNRETSSEAPQTPTAEKLTLSPAAAALARKEAKFRSQEQELRAKEQALEAERKEIAELKQIKAKLAEKDYSAVENLVNYDEYTNYLIDKSTKTTPEQEEIKKLYQKLESLEKNQQDDVSKRFDAAVNERRNAVKELVLKDESFTTIKELKAEETVVQHILDTWENDNIDLTVEQAAKEVEELLLEKATKWASLTKVKGTLQEKKELPSLKPGVKTLTNNMTPAGETKPIKKSFNGMSEQERYKEAYRRAQEKLKG